MKNKKIIEKVIDVNVGKAKGENGITPRVGSNENWFEGDKDTGKPSRGKDGQDGKSVVIKGHYNTLEELKKDHPIGTDGDAWTVGSLTESYIYVWSSSKKNWENIGKLQGEDGKDGEDGFSPKISDDKTWIDKNGDTKVKAEGIDGYDPKIKDSYWHNREGNTGVRAEGRDGKDGFNPYIDTNDKKWIDSKGKTNIVAEGIDGFSPKIVNKYWYDKNGDTKVKAEGEDGITPKVGDNENWFYNEKDSGKPSRGRTGKDGLEGTDMKVVFFSSQSEFEEHSKKAGLSNDKIYAMNGTGATESIKITLKNYINNQVLFDGFKSNNLYYAWLVDFPVTYFTIGQLQRLIVIGYKGATGYTLNHIIFIGGTHNNSTKPMLMILKTDNSIIDMDRIEFTLGSSATTRRKWTNLVNSTTNQKNYRIYSAPDLANHEFLIARNWDISAEKTAEGLVGDYVIYTSKYIRNPDTHVDFTLGMNHVIICDKTVKDGKQLTTEDEVKKYSSLITKEDKYLNPNKIDFFSHSVTGCKSQKNMDMPMISFNDNITNQLNTTERIKCDNMAGYTSIAPDFITDRISRQPIYTILEGNTLDVSTRVILVLSMKYKTLDITPEGKKLTYESSHPPNLNQKFYYHKVGL
jgi:hypothetical protein